MAKITLTSRDKEKKGSLMSFESLLIFGLAVAVFAAIWAVGSTVIQQGYDGSESYETQLQDMSSSF